MPGGATRRRGLASTISPRRSSVGCGLHFCDHGPEPGGIAPRGSGGWSLARRLPGWASRPARAGVGAAGGRSGRGGARAVSFRDLTVDPLAQPRRRWGGLASRTPAPVGPHRPALSFKRGENAVVETGAGNCVVE